jgi:hypothetical protein
MDNPENNAAENVCPNGVLLCVFGDPLLCGCGKLTSDESDTTDQPETGSTDGSASE